MRSAATARFRSAEPPPDAADTAAAAEAALRILRAAGQSAAALQQRLEARGYTAEAAAEAVQRVQARGYVDDAALAASVAGRAQAGGRGRARIAAELRARGVAGEAIGQVLAAMDPEVERQSAEQAARVLSARILAGGRPNARGRLVAALQRRGFSDGVIRQAIATVVEEGRRS